MSIPCLKLATPTLSDFDRLIVEFFQLDAELKQRIYLHHFGWNATTGKNLEPGKRMWNQIYRSNNWLRYQEIMNCYEHSQARYQALQQEQYRCHLRNQENIAKYGPHFETIINQLLTTDPDKPSTVYFPLMHSYFSRPPLVNAADCDYKKTHACPQCLMILDPRKFEPYYKVESNCSCDCESYFEFIWCEWQPLEIQSFVLDSRPAELPTFQI